MKIVVDADACPVKREIVKAAGKSGIPVIMVCDTSHVIEDGYSRVITVDKGSDSADYRIVNAAKAGDIVVTGDYGLAAMALSKGARAISFNGVVYNDLNIDLLLNQRHFAKESRRRGKRASAIKKRNSGQDAEFYSSFITLIEELID